MKPPQPLTDLHTHFEGSLTRFDLEEVLIKGGRTNLKSKISIPPKPKAQSLANFIGRLATPSMREILKSLPVKERQKYLKLFFEKSLSNYSHAKVSKLGLFVSPLALSKEAKIDVTTYLKIFRNIANTHKNPIVNLRYCIRREKDLHFTNQRFSQQNPVIKEAISCYKKGLIDGFDIAGNETIIPLSNFTNFLSYLKSQRIPFSAHAGELPQNHPDSYSNLAWAITLEAKSIGHGVRLFDENETADYLLKEVVIKKILIEINLTSNSLTGVAPKNLAKHPFIKFLKTRYKKAPYSELQFAICSDDPAITGYVEKEWGKLFKAIKTA